MSNRPQRRETARETVEVLDRGEYVRGDGSTVSIAASLDAARAGTVVYTPDQVAAVVARERRAEPPYETEFVVRNETTLAAARRLVEEGFVDPLCLNFASAKNPGGGFLGGSQAQEESLARASGLYACLEPATTYYEANRAAGTSLYTNHAIHSPRVPVFRDDEDGLLDEPYEVSMLTMPAVNTGAVTRNEPRNRSQIEPLMRERIAAVLAIALAHGHQAVVLGAWGCGVFRNDPDRVAEWFHEHLTGGFRGAFRRVAFAVLDHSPDESTFHAFSRRFEGPGGDGNGRP